MQNRNAKLMKNIYFDQSGKEKLYQQFKERLLGEIAKDGLKIGDRWILNQ